MRYKDLFEAKQVGVLYHFTDFQTAWVILSDQKLEAKKGGGISSAGGMFIIDRFRDWVSLTRNYKLMKTPSAGSAETVVWGDARIAIDGDKLSHRNRIEPYHDVDDYLTRQDNQAEERIRKTEVDLIGCIIQVDVMVDLFMRNATDWDSWVAQDLTDEDKAKYTKMSEDNLTDFFEWCQQNSIKAEAVWEYRPVSVSFLPTF